MPTSRFARLIPLALVLAAGLSPALALQDEKAAPPPAPKASEGEKPDDSMVRPSLVKILTTSREPDIARPWMKGPPQESSGSGVVIDGKRIITNNHVIEYATRVLVQPEGSSDKLTAKVVASAPGIDLAVLEITDKEADNFFKDHPAVAISDDLPFVGQTVYALGYPVGGDSVSITKGVVSRIEHTSYNGSTSGLRIQIDAAINPGNSGGPAILNNQLIGLAFSGLGGADNVGYIIPVEEIRAFLDDIKDGKFDGRPQLFDQSQTAENDALRAKLGLSRAQTGLVLTKVDSSKPDFPLKKWDLITKIGDKEIDNTGQTQLRPNLRVSFRYFVPKLAKDGKIPLTIVREGKEMQVEVPVQATPEQLMKPLNGTYPSFFVLGPMCFTGVSEEHADRLSRAMLERKSPIATRKGDKPRFEGEELVIGPARLFSHPIMKGYELPFFPVLKTLNGTPVKNLKHLVELVSTSTDKYLVFEWDDEAAETVVFDREELLKSTDDVLEENQVRNQMSDDLKSAWEKK